MSLLSKEHKNNKTIFHTILIGEFHCIHSFLLNLIKEYSQNNKEVLFFIINKSKKAQNSVLLDEKEQKKVLNSFGFNNIEHGTLGECVSYIRKLTSCLSTDESLNIICEAYQDVQLFSDIAQTNVHYNEKIAQYSNNIKEFVAEGSVEKAAQDLAYYYFISGKVIKGNKIGRELGFPTANVKIDDISKIIPALGVYVALTKIENKWYQAMVNIGTRPTLNLKDVSIEAHLFSYDGDLYNKKAEIHLISHLRPEMKFSNTQDLSEQLKRDKKTALSLFNENSIMPDPSEKIVFTNQSEELQ